MLDPSSHDRGDKKRHAMICPFQNELFRKIIMSTANECLKLGANIDVRESWEKTGRTGSPFDSPNI